MGKEKNPRMRRRHEEEANEMRLKEKQREGRGAQGADWQAFYYIPLVGD